MKFRAAYGKVIRAARVKRGLSLRETASLSHISLSHLFEVEKGQAEPSSEYLAAILRTLDIAPEDFFTQVASQYEVAA